VQDPTPIEHFWLTQMILRQKLISLPSPLYPKNVPASLPRKGGRVAPPPPPGSLTGIMSGSTKYVLKKNKVFTTFRPVFQAENTCSPKIKKVFTRCE